MKIVKKTLLTAFVIFFLILPAASFAASSTKVGILDINELINRSEAGKIASKKLKVKVEEVKKRLTVKGEEIKAFQEKLERESLVMSNAAKEDSKRKFREKLNELQKMRERSNREIAGFEKELIDPIYSDILKIVKDYSAKKGYSLIIDKKAGGVFYSLDSIDITSEIMKLYNAEFRSKKR